MIDHTKGEVKLIRGSGPPIITVESEVVEIAARLYLLSRLTYRPSLPQPCEVIGIDLTRRLVRLQILNGKEVVYSADGESRDGGSYWLFSAADNARKNSAAMFKDAIQYAEEKADDAIADLAKAKADAKAAENWQPPDQ